MRCGTVEYLVGCIDYKMSTFACLLVLSQYGRGDFFFSLSSFLSIVLLFTLRRFYFLHAPRSCHARNGFSIHVHTPCSLRKQPDPLFINRIFLFLPLLIGGFGIHFYSVLGFGSSVAPSAL